MSAPLVYAALPTGPLQLAVDVAEPHPVLPAATYSALRSYQGACFLRLEDHIARTRGSMQRMGFDFELDEPSLRRAIDAAARAHADLHGGDCKLRFDVYAEPFELAGQRLSMLVVVSALHPIPDAFRAEGVGMSITRELSRSQPLVKNAAWVRERAPYLLQSQDVFDALMVDDQQRVLEGSTCNFFAVIDGALHTTEAGVLEGVTRRIVLELAREQGVPTHLGELTLQELRGAQEAFLTSSSRHLLPVVRVSDAPIGDGTPGPRTRALMSAYEDYAATAAKPALNG